MFRSLLVLTLLAAPLLLAECQPLGFSPRGLPPVAVLDQADNAQVSILRTSPTSIALGLLPQPQDSQGNARAAASGRIIPSIDTSSLFTFVQGVCGAEFASRFYSAKASIGGASTAVAPVNGLAIGDFNGDGVLDQAAASGNTIFVSLMRADGTQISQSQLGLSQSAAQVVVANTNGDGRPDLIVLAATYSFNANRYESVVTTHIGNANGTFQQGVPALTGNLWGLGAGDLNGDGLTDFVINDFTTQRMRIMSAGSGAFTQVTQLTASGIPVIADVTGDGKPDIVFAGAGTCVAVNQGATFPVACSGTEAVGAVSAITDLNNDGKLDVALDGSFSMAIQFGNGSGAFSDPVRYGGIGGGLTPIRFADGSSVLLASGYTEPLLYIIPVQANGDISLYPYGPSFSTDINRVNGLLLDDMNGDGRNDAVVSAFGYQVSLRTQAGGWETGRPFTPQVANRSANTYSGLMRSGDLDGDGKRDLAFSFVSNTQFNAPPSYFDILRGNGDGTVQAAQLLGNATMPQDLLIAKLEKATKPDIVVAEGGTSLRRYRNAGDGTFPTFDNLPAGQLPVVASVAGDFNGDGNVDLAYAANPLPTLGTNAGYVGTILITNGNYQARPTINVGNPAGQPFQLAAADFNGDNKLDLVVLFHANATPHAANTIGTNLPAVREQIQVLNGDGSGGFQAGPIISLWRVLNAEQVNGPNSLSGGSSPTLAVADINGDGFSDILYALGYILGKGDGTFRHPVAVPGLDDAAWGDLNGDGKVDVIGVTTETTFSPGIVNKLYQSIQLNNFADLPPLTGPIITSVNVGGGGSTLAPNAWIEVKGVNLAPASTANGVVWSSAPEFAQGKMPTTIAGVSATANGKPAYVYYVSPTQVNLLLPLDVATGAVQIVIKYGTTTVGPFTATRAAVSPAFFLLGATKYVAATHANGTLLGPASMSVPGYTFTPARPNETITLYANGFGLPASALTEGASAQFSALPQLPVIRIGNTTSTVAFAGVVAPGLYQFNVTIPASATTGDNTLAATYGGASTPSGAVIAVQR